MLNSSNKSPQKLIVTTATMTEALYLYGQFDQQAHFLVFGERLKFLLEYP